LLKICKNQKNIVILRQNCNTSKIMSNADFWQSIQTIIEGGYSSEGLHLLDNYAEQFINGKLLYQRFSLPEQRGCAAGGSTNVIATILAGASIAPNCLTAPIGSFKREQQCGEIQASRIERWAKRVGCWVDCVNDRLQQQFGQEVAQGGEARVFYHGASLIKMIGLDYYVTPVLALDRIALYNTYFPETKLIVLGFGRDSEGAFQIIVEQPFVQGKSLSEAEIEKFATNLGFELKNRRNWTYATAEIYLSDLHDENVIQSKEGIIFVIDCDIRINTPDLKMDGIRQLSSEVAFTE